MFVRIALFLVALWIAMQLLRWVFGGLIHLLIIGAVIFLIIHLVDRSKKPVA